MDLWNPRPVSSEELERSEEPAASSGFFASRGAKRVLLVAMVLGTLRFLALGEWSLWIDEAYTLADARTGTGHLNPVGYALFDLWYGLAEGRPDELWMRLPAALFGWLAIPLSVWALVPFVGRRAAALAALVVAVSPWHLYWSQNARFYTLAQCFGLVGVGLLVRGIRDVRVAGLVAAGVFLLLGAATHPSAAMLMGAALFAPVLLARLGKLRVPPGVRLGRPLAIVFVVALVASVPWMRDVWHVWSRRQGVGDPVHLVLTTGYLLTPVVGLGVLLGTFEVLRGRRPKARLLVAIAAGVLGLAFVASFFVRVSAQYVFVAMPLLAALAALPCARSEGSGAPGAGTRLARRRAAAWIYGLVLTLPLGVESALYFTQRHGDRPRWREAYQHVFENRRWTDLVLGMQAPVGQYYWAPWSVDLRQWGMVVQLDQYRAGVAGDWLRYGRRIWFVVNHEELYDWGERERDQMRRILAERCTEEAYFPVPWTPRDLNVSVYLLDPATDGAR